jgi:hypothetical protein
VSELLMPAARIAADSGGKPNHRSGRLCRASVGSASIRAAL